MTPSQFWQDSTAKQKKDLAAGADTTVGNLQQIARGGSCGSRLAERLAKSAAEIGVEMSELEILYPERFENEAA